MTSTLTMIPAGMLQRLLLACIVFGFGTYSAYGFRACPVFCDCIPDKTVGTGALRAECGNEDMTEVPQLTPNVTSVALFSKRLTTLDGFAFMDAPYLRTIHVEASELVSIDTDAFQSLSNLSSITIKSKVTTRLATGLFRNLTGLANLKFAINLTQIPSDKLCEVPRLQSLDLGFNKISSLSFDPCVSRTWHMLNLLILASNLLHSIQGDNFKQFENISLKQLSLSQCELVDLPSDLFRYLTHLNFLDIGKNKITSLPPGIFDSLYRLETLVLGETYLTEIPLTASTPFLPILRDLNVGGCKHMNVTFGRAFLKATRLQQLMIYSLQLGVLGDSFFENLVNSPVKEVNLMGSHINGITTASFSPLRSLVKLTLNLNSIKPETAHNVSIAIGRTPLEALSIDNAGLMTLDNQTFGGFSPNNSLSYLSLQNNFMKTIGRNSFVHLSRVTTLKLAQNLLTLDGLEEDAFSGIHSLQRLYLDYNQLINMPERVHLGIPSTLKILSLVQNRLVYLTYESFEDWQNLTELYLINNNIKTLGRGIFKSFEKLTVLDLGQNQIGSLYEDAFNSTTSLETLSLHDNKLTHVPLNVLRNLSTLIELQLQKNPNFARSTGLLATAFRKLTNVKKLQLLQCGIKSLPTNMFVDNHELDMLQLSVNQISSWDPELFKPLHKVTILSLSNNKITSVNKTSFIHLASIRRLDLSGNPLSCTCDLVWFKHWISTADLYLVNYGVKGKYSCASPQTEKGTALVDFQLSDNDCASNLLLQLSIGLCSGFALVCAIISLTYRYWWYIRYYIFLMRSRRRQAQDALFENDAFKYDVYVCYHNTSRWWVINKLLPELEYRGGIKLCLHDRDWLAGPPIVDNIVESIEHSRKTLLLVNNGFALSAWCREETSLAHSRLIEQQRNLLTVVLLEDIQPENMDKTLRSILSKRVFLKFKEGRHKEPKFWKALRAALGKSEHGNAGVQMMRTPNS